VEAKILAVWMGLVGLLVQHLVFDKGVPEYFMEAVKANCPANVKSFVPACVTLQGIFLYFLCSLFWSEGLKKHYWRLYGNDRLASERKR